MLEITNNKVMLRGNLQTDMSFYEEREGKKIYKGTVAVKSLKRRIEDEINILVSEEILLEKQKDDKKIEIIGEIELDKGKCNVFVKKMHYLKEEYEPDANFIFLEAYIMQKANKKGKNAILTIALSPEGATYIKCRCSKRISERVSGFQVGRKVTIDGKIISKRKNKKLINEIVVYQI